MKLRHMQTIVIIIFAAILISLGWYLFIRKDSTTRMTYTNPAYGVSFSYPSKYTLRETPAEGSQAGTVVTLTEKGIHIPNGGDGPTAITVGMYEGTGTSSASGKDPLAEWIHTSSYSNFNLSKQDTLGTTTLSDMAAFLYTWDGLYQGTSVAVLNDGNPILFSVTYDGEADLSKRSDFTDLVASVQFSPAATSSSATPTSTETRE